MALRGGRPKGAGLRHRQNPRDRNLAVRKHPGETILHKWAAMVQMGRCEGLPRRNLSGIKRIWQSDALKQRLAGVQSLVSHPRFNKIIVKRIESQKTRLFAQKIANPFTIRST